MTDFVVCHGAWGAGYSWRKMRPLMRAAGHELWTPSYTGMGERAHLAHPMVDLETHARDVIGVIEYEDLADIVLVGHSYGGMVVSLVADRLAPRVRHVVYLDAFVPRDGDSLDDLRLPGGHREALEGWLVPPNPSAADTSAEDLAWLTPRRRHQPVRTFTQKARLGGAIDGLPRTYVWCSRKDGPDNFRQFAERTRSDPAWGFVEMDASHSPMVTAPEALSQVLLGVL